MTYPIARAHQTNACALRQLMGLPLHQPANDCILFGTGLQLGER